MLLSLTSVFCFKSASAATDGEWKYELENGGVTITGFIGTSRTISVPSKVNGQRVKKVTALNNNNTKASVTTVSFANGIEEIGTGVCKGYISLERVALPDTLVTIGSDAFFNCSSLTGITIPELRYDHRHQRIQRLYRSYQRRPQLQGYCDSRRIIHRVQVADYSCASLLYH